MFFYIIDNGYIGNSYVRVYVVASDDQKALELAKTSFREKASERNYPNSFWTQCHIVLKLPANKEFVSKVED